MKQNGTASKWVWPTWTALCLLWAANAAYDWSLHRWVSPSSIILLIIFVASLVMSLRGAPKSALNDKGNKGESVLYARCHLGHDDHSWDADRTSVCTTLAAGM